ncbi:DNA repair protein, partial [Oleispira antarctica]
MAEHNSNQVENAVAEGGAYEVIRKRLVGQGQLLNQQAGKLNEARLAEFGSSDLSVISRVRVRTENNCVARDMVQVGDYLLFGYNVFIGLKKETTIDDVFSLFKLNVDSEQYSLEVVSHSDSFLTSSSFQSDFSELYRYYKQTRLVQLTMKDGKLLAGFQIGERLEDIRVFRWSVSADGKDITYIDNRGERDIQLPSSYDFDWLETDREDTVHGRHPHINILDKVFVETINGDLTIKIENNTEQGNGIYSEPVEDATQSLDDGQFFYASVGALILLKILPYREDQWRYFVFNSLTDEVVKIDGIGQSCVQLPEDHGIIFPGGYYLQSGEMKTFEGDSLGSSDNDQSLKFKRMIKSPNGEDVLFVFYQPEEGLFGLFSYNLISKSMQNPIYGHGYALAEDGKLVIFSAENEPTRIHPMQIWQTAYVSADFASRADVSQSFFGKIGNASLVRGVSDLYSLHRMISDQTVSARIYEELSKTAGRFFDSHYWIEEYSAQQEDVNKDHSIAALIKQISQTSELVIDEFEKVQSIRQQSQQAMSSAEDQQQELIISIRPENWQVAEEFVAALNKLRQQRGHLATIKEFRYIDGDRLTELDQQLIETQEKLSESTVEFLSQDAALSPYFDKIVGFDNEVTKAETIAVLTPVIEEIEETASGLDLLSELMSSLKVNDATVRTRIIDAISEVYSKLNQSKAAAKHKQKSLGSE